MKTTIIKLASFVLMFCVTTAAFASGKQFAEISLKENQNVEIHLASPISGILTVNVYNESGRKIYEQSIHTSHEITVGNNVTSWPEGIYTYEVISNTELVYRAKVIKMADGSLESRDENTETLAAVTPTEQGQVVVRLVKNDDQKAKIAITDIYGDVLYKRIIKKSGYFKITHDISEFPSGTYIFKVYNGKEMIALRKITR